jgi:small-conductance mechanosensitive channel
LTAAQNRFAAQAEPPPALMESVEALTARRDAVRDEIALADTQLERLDSQRTLWQQWDAVLRDRASREEVDVFETAALERIGDLKQRELRRRGNVLDLQQRLEAIDRRLTGLDPASPLRPTIEAKREALGRSHLAQAAEASAIASDLRLTQRFLADIQEREWRIDPVETLVLVARKAREAWSYEITTVDDSPIRVGSFVVALVLFGIGMWTSRRGSIIVGRIAQSRFKLDVGAAHALQTISFYILIVGFTLLALRAVHFPLTAFTVLGGALAIGIGFGSQNVMNNFISGLILMLERPVRARDVVEVDGNNGMIEHIGARSTQIRSTDGRHIIVPNSFFLETNVVNWTLSDDLIRTKVTVGVVYGSPTRLVNELILRVVTEDERVLAQPEPIVIFNEFGDNSLNFDAYFWVKARSPMDVRKVASDVRFRIDDVFREHQLIIAFPQRDVHIDSTRPIEVRVLDANQRSTPDERSKTDQDSE